jgi:cbb3-type cytochrome oxidase maturation protein|tara:strand:+ start:4968 stop:5177 length:210 start_codon:yes stop_codon:yes gene_type:complete
MEVLFVLIPVSLILITLAISIFGWAVKNGQYDDLEGPAHSILYDDDADMIPGPDDKPKPKTNIKAQEPN